MHGVPLLGKEAPDNGFQQRTHSSDRMNLNLANARPVQVDIPHFPASTLQQDIEGNNEVLQRTGEYNLTGATALVSDPIAPGVYRVWHETTGGTWIWVDHEGVQHEADSPLDGGL